MRLAETAGEAREAAPPASGRKSGRADTPVRRALRATALVCLAAAALALGAAWSGAVSPEAEGTLTLVAVVLCLWANLLSLGLRLARPRR